MNCYRLTALRMLAALALCLSLGGAISGQEITGSLTGVVTDPAGAVVANADIILTNTATREERRAQTDEGGSYVLARVTPGIYNLSVRAQGFKEHVLSAVEVNVNDRRTLNITIETGDVSETVVVTSDAPLIQTSPTVGNVVENRRVVEMPLNNRNFMQLLTLVPGVTSSGTSEVGIGLTNTVNFSINGTRRNAINFLVDGVTNSDVGSNITLLSVPTVDSIQEFRVITSIPGAEFGRSGGGVVNLITRGGGNEFHGTLYEFLRNDKLNANSFLNNANGRFPANDPRAGLERSPRPKLRYNNFGYLVSGPVILPRFGEGGPATYNGRDRTFFLFSHEFRRIIRAPAESTITVPSLLERQGNFSEAGNVPIFDPLTGQQFPGNIIPANRIDPAALSVLNLYPLPNVASTVAGRAPNRFAVTSPNIQNTRQETVRIDHSINSSHNLTGRYTRDLSQTRELGGLFFGVTVPDIATTDTNVPGQILAINLTSTFGPNVVNEALFTFSGNEITTNLVGNYTRGNVTIPNQELFAENNSGLPPTVVITGFPTLGAGQLFDIQYKNWNPKNNTTVIRGPHTIKFGADVSFEAKNENAANESQGRFTFSGLQTRVSNPAASGIALADLLLGRASSYSEPERDVTLNLRFGRTEFYVQDTWKARPNFQLDYGLRYYRFRQAYDTNNVLATFQPQFYSAARAPQCANVTCTTFTTSTFNLTNGFAYAGVNSPFDRRVQKPDKNDWGPRIGFAWDPRKNGRTVFRGGYGIYYDQALVGIVEQNSFTTPPFNNSLALTGTVQNPITYQNPNAGAAATTRGTLGTVNATTDPFDTPVVQQWSLTWQQEPFRNAMFEIGYSGSAGNNLIRPVDLNAPPPAAILAAAQGVAGCDPALNTANNPNTCINLARPYRGFGSIIDRQTSATSRYHGLLSSFQLRDRRGLTAQLSYTWSKTLTDATNDRDAIDIPQVITDFQLERAVSRLDRTHVFVASYIYQVPVWKSGFASTTAGRLLLSGWEIAGISTAQTGLALNRVVQGATVGPRGSRPNLISDPTENIPENPTGGRPYLFNPLAFRPTPVGAIGNSGRSPFRFPSQFFTDVNLAKNLLFTERYRLQLRAEFFNVFNQTIFDDVFQTIPDRLPTDAAFNNIQNLVNTGSQFGQAFSTRNPREIQLGIKFYF